MANINEKEIRNGLNKDALGCWMLAGLVNEAFETMVDNRIKNGKMQAAKKNAALAVTKNYVEYLYSNSDKRADDVFETLICLLDLLNGNDKEIREALTMVQNRKILERAAAYFYC